MQNEFLLFACVRLCLRLRRVAVYSLNVESGARARCQPNSSPIVSESSEEDNMEFIPIVFVVGVVPLIAFITS